VKSSLGTGTNAIAAADQAPDALRVAQQDHSGGKEAFELAFEELGGVEQLTAWGRSLRGEFYKLFARLIPIRNELPGGAEESALAICVECVSPPSREGV
jgi:hypothetical protein